MTIVQFLPLNMMSKFCFVVLVKLRLPAGCKSSCQIIES